MPEVGSGEVSIRPDLSHFSRDLTNGVNRGIDGSLDHIKSGFAKVGKVASVAIAGIGVAGAGFLTKAVMSASDLNETLSKVGVVFGDQQKIVTGFADQMAKDFGTPKRSILDAASAIGLIGKASGLSQGDAAKMSTQLAKLASDASSFYNVPLPEALQAIQSGLVGEAEPMRRFGVLLNEDAVKAEALRLGLVKTAADTSKMSAAAEKVSIAQAKAAEASKKFGADSLQARSAALAVSSAQDALAKASAGVTVELTEGQKAQARASLITRGMADATGDLERTQGSFSNRLRELRGRAENFAAAVGTKVLPVVLDALDLFERWGRVVAEKVGPIIAEIGGGLRAFFAAFKDGGDDVTSAGLAGVFERIGIAARNLFDWLKSNVLPVLKSVWAFVKGNLVPVLSALGVIIGGVLLAGVVALATAVAALLSPFVLITVAVAAAVGGVVYAYRHFAAFRNVVATVASFLTGTVAPAFGEVARAVVDTLGPAVEWVKRVWPQVSEAIGHVVDVAAGLIRSFVDGVSAIWRAWGDDIFGVVKRVFDGIRETINNVLQVITGLIRTVVAVINGDWGRAWDALKSVVSAAWDQVKNIISTAIGAIRGLLGGVVSTFGEVFRPLGNFLHTWIGQPLIDIVESVRGMPKKIADAAVGMFDGIKNAFRSALNFIIKAWNSLDFTIPGFDPPGPGPKFPSITLGVPDIKELARGGTLRPGELALTGERGPELIQGGVAGSRVFPNDQLMASVGTNVDMGGVTLNGIRDGEDALTRLPTRIAAELFLAGG